MKNNIYKELGNKELTFSSPRMERRNLPWICQCQETAFAPLGQVALTEPPDDSRYRDSKDNNATVKVR